jgi:uncharacterized integral membrane protein
MLNRIILVVVLVPLAVILIALAVANRGAVMFTLDPFNPGNPALSVQLPLFVYLLVCVMIGVVIGSTITWFRQSRYRRLAKQSQAAERARFADSETSAQSGALVRS